MEIIERLLALGRRQVGTVADGEHLGNPVVLLQKRAPDDLGWMGGEHELHPHRSDSRHQRVGRHAGTAQPPKRLGARPPLRLAVRIAGVIAPPVHAMVLLGDVGEGQEVRKGTGDGQRRSNGHLTEEPICTCRIRLRAGVAQRYGGQA